MAIDIGSILFEDILGMTYPGSPFTGNPINDLVMYFFIPTILIIGFIWIIVDKLRFIQSNKLKLLFALAIYLFIIFGGYFSFFALISGPYLIVLIFVLGILWFIGGHFGGKKSSAGGAQDVHYAAGGGAATAEQSFHGLPKRLQGMVLLPSLNLKERRELERALKGFDGRIEKLTSHLDEMKATGAHGTGLVVIELDRLIAQRNMIEKALKGD